MSFRRQLPVLAVLSAVLLTGCPYRATPDYDGLARITDAPTHIVLSIGENAATDRTIVWKTSDDVEETILEYHAAGLSFAEAVRVNGTCVKRETEVANYCAHEVRLTGLPAGAYTYRVGNGEPEDWSGEYTFVVPQAGRDTLRVAVLGDSRTYMDVWGETLADAASHEPDVILHTGDLVTDGNDLIHWYGWFAQTEGVLQSIPFMPVAGNHEHASPEYFLSFALPENSTDGLREEAFSFELGPAHIVGLHSCRKLDEQTAWLEDNLKGVEAPWTFVYYHRPAYSGTLLRGDGEKDIREAWAPVFDWFEVDLAFQGHNHNYFRTQPIYQNSVADEGTIYVTTGGAGAPLYPVASNEWRAAAEKSYHYVILEVTAANVTSTAYRLDGSIIDRFVLSQ